MVLELGEGQLEHDASIAQHTDPSSRYGAIYLQGGFQKSSCFMQALLAVVVATKITLFNFFIFLFIAIMAPCIVVALRSLLAQLEDWMVVDNDVVFDADSKLLHQSIKHAFIKLDVHDFVLGF